MYHQIWCRLLITSSNANAPPTLLTAVSLGTRVSLLPLAALAAAPPLPFRFSPLQLGARPAVLLSSVRLVTSTAAAAVPISVRFILQPGPLDFIAPAAVGGEGTEAALNLRVAHIETLNCTIRCRFSER